MSEYELVDLALTSLGHLGAAALYSATMIFAYLVAAYVVGQKLPQTVLWFLSLVYTGALLAPIFGMQAGIAAYNRTVYEYQMSYPDGLAFIGGDSSGISDILRVLTLLPVVIAWAGSLIFMHFYMGKRRNVDS